MEKVVIAVIDKSGFDPKIVYIEIMAEKGMRTNDVLNSIELACQDFYNTEEGKNCISDYRDFGYDEFDRYVPNSICEKYGISKISKDTYVIEVENEVLVNAEDLLNNKELEDEDYELWNV